MSTNYYLGLKRGEVGNPGKVVAGTSSNGTNSDIELRMQIVNGATATGLTRFDVYQALCVLETFINSNGLPAGGTQGTDLPAT